MWAQRQGRVRAQHSAGAAAPGRNLEAGAEHSEDQTAGSFGDRKQGCPEERRGERTHANVTVHGLPSPGSGQVCRPDGTRDASQVRKTEKTRRTITESKLHRPGQRRPRRKTGRSLGSLNTRQAAFLCRSGDPSPPPYPRVWGWNPSTQQVTLRGQTRGGLLAAQAQSPGPSPHSRGLIPADPGQGAPGV